MVKWCNKCGEMAQIIHKFSHGEMVKYSSGDILFAKWKDGETVILTFVRPIIHAPPSLMRFQYRLLTPTAAASTLSTSFSLGSSKLVI